MKKLNTDLLIKGERVMKKFMKLLKKNRKEIIAIEAVVLVVLLTVLLTPIYPILGMGLWMLVSTLLIVFTTE